MRGALLFVFLAASASASAADDEPVPVPGVECRGDICLIPFAVLNAMIDMHNKHVEDIRALKAAGPKCAQIDVTEPSKNAPPQDKKKMPPIKSEAKS